ncbi:MAG: radical SAM protein [Gemmatimonadetes bacterium]|nr:radical SAM protein [Gemmatimonadota bacterium]
MAPLVPPDPRGAPAVFPEPSAPARAWLPHVVAWNLTRRCNLACAHCYISAGSWHAAAGELDTAACTRILGELLAVNPAPLLILSGGEPLLRDDLETLAERASAAGATVVVGTNGTRLTDARIQSLVAAGVKGVAVSIDSLQDRYHDRFRHGEGSLQQTLAAVERCRAHRLDFIVQTTVTRGNRDELPAIASWAAERGAVAFNVYFVVPTGRAEGMAGLAPEENDAVLRGLLELEGVYRGRMMVRSKCQPQIMRHVLAAAGAGDQASPLLNYETRCPCGTQYCRITPEGKVTPCPYTPTVAGDLTTTSFGEIWDCSPVFQTIRGGALGGKCGRCEFKSVCGGCRARAYAETGDLMGPDESCAYEPTGAVPVVEPHRTVTYGSSPAAPVMEWAPEAALRMQGIPSFVRAVVTERVERFARERGYARVDLDVIAEVRRAMPVDFSRSVPFFLRKEGEA